MSRDIKQCTPELQEKYELFCYEMDGADIPFILTCAKRTQKEQDALYEQGRTKPGKIVTWTRKSKHVEGKAFDICVLKDGKADWNAESYNKPGEIGERIGLIWGGRWKTPDRPHFEIK